MTAEDPRPLLSIVCICYNQEEFIEQALDGFLAQQVDFPIEIIVADDASTDRTPAIIAAYSAEHPGLVRPILRPVNVGVQANLVDAMQTSRGRYIALCEGDDYWTDSAKLARQVAHLEQHPEVSVCFHRVEVRRDGDDSSLVFPSADLSGDEVTLERLLGENLIQTNSVVYRRLDSYAAVPLDILPLDWYLHVLHALRGSIMMLPEVMSVYRRHPGGIWWESESVGSTFWTKNGPAMARMCQAVIELLHGDPRREAALSGYSVLIGTRVLDSPAGAGPLLGGLVDEAPLWAEQWLRSQHARLSDLEGHAESLSTVAADRLSAIRQLERDVTDLREALAAAHEVATARASQLVRSKRALEAKSAKLAAKREQVARGRARIERQAARIAQLTRRVDALQEELDATLWRRAARRLRQPFGRRTGETSA